MKRPPDCDSIQLVDVFDLVLGSDDTRRVPQPRHEHVRRHLESCPRCRARVVDVTTIARGVATSCEERSIPIADDFEAKLQARIEAIDAPAATEGRRRKTTTKKAAPPPAPAPLDPQRVREVLAGPRPRTEPIRTGVSAAGFDPSRPAYWLPMAAAVLLLAGGGYWTIRYLMEYEPPKKQPPVADREAPSPGSPTAGPEAAEVPAGPDVAVVPDSEEDFPPIPEIPIPQAPPADPLVDDRQPEEEPARREPERAIAGREPEAEPPVTVAAVLLHVKSQKGELSIVSGDGASRAWERGATLTSGETLAVAAGGMAEVEIVGGGSLLIDADSLIAVSRVGDVHEVALARGRAVFSTGPDETPLRVRTANAEIRRAARFAVEADGSGTRVVALEGEAIVAAGSGEVTVPAGTESLVRAGGAPEAPSPVDALEATSWTLGLATGRTTEFEDRFEGRRPGRVDDDAFATRSADGWAVPFAWFDDRDAARRAARFEGGALRLEAGAVFSPRLALVEGESYAATFRLRAEAPATEVELLVVAQGEDGPAWTAERRVAAGTGWSELSVRAEIPLSLPPGTRYWAACRSDSPVEIGGLLVERLHLPSSREVDHDFHRRQPAGWQRASGSWKRETAGVAARPAGRSAALLVLPPTAAYLGDYSVAVAGRAEKDGQIGLALRIADERNHYRFVTSAAGDTRRFRLEAVEDGEVRLLAERTVEDAGRPGVHLEVHAHGTTLEAYAEGALVLRVEDRAFRRGAVGLVALGEPARFHRLIVEDYR